MVSTLTVNNHDRDVAGLKYVYPVISRRAGGLSIGINFNVNNACNWRCIYCQVPDLTIGAAPDLDFQLLEEELRFFLNDVLHGDFYQRFQVDEDKRMIKDIAMSGNGEPTSVKDFDRAVALIGKVATEAGVLPQSHFVLITNGSLLHRPGVQNGLKKLKEYGGEVWFKFDSATDEGRALINNAGQSCRASVDNLLLAAKLCPTKLQTCLLDYDKRGLPEPEKHAFLELLKGIKVKACVLEGVMLYTLARPSLQPESMRLEKLSVGELNAFADEIRLLGFEVWVSA
ncbi:MAG: radical SAM protein [Methylobacter sp.]|uniref:radical SAM protein n=1 Tax=Methylicorpusculum sp. TaxID=2713644 RepID=UPI00272653EC|nr:radical SAM protein [Methylicorpusculum sp.]MDO9141038.1 radical SAM protein [Methylobacter sp.]MDP2178413.1 radical SAM protein [Methylicorpusculum sp.]MDP2429651.1 radical SAM protein [Methylobacter sp.]MDP3053903.1 radical SAM protein [Methylobacter sp.]MDP3360654.1 radical SAM protein [Methylobacter sp.]